MSSIDNRVVYMKFDNDGFERGVKETTRSLDGLKKDMNFDGAKNSLNGLSAATGKFSFAGMADGLDNVTSKFSILKAIGFSVIQKLTQSAMDFAGRGIKGLLDPLIQGGKKRALAIEQAKFQFRGLGMDVDKTMASALAAVKGTAFGLDDAAKAAAMFGASGMRAGKEMTGSLRGIAGVAAMSGSSYEDIANVFTKVAGQGRLMGDDLNRLASRGVNAAATLAKSMGKTEAEVRAMVTKGKISFKDFAAAMDDAFGAHATKASETYTGALANMKAALSRIGASFFTPYFEAMRNIFNALTPVIDDVATALEPLIKAFTSLSIVVSKKLSKSLGNLDLSRVGTLVKPIIAIIRGLGEALWSIIKPIKDAFTDIFPAPTLNSLLVMAYRFNDFTASLKLGGETANNLKRTFAGLFAVLGIAWEIIKAVAKGLGVMFGAAQKSSGGILEFTGTIGDFLVSLHKAIKNGGLLTGFFKTLGAVLSLPITILGGIGDLLAGIFTGFDKAGGNSVNAIFGRMGDRMKPIERLTDGIRKALGKLSGIFKAVGKAFKPFTDGISKLFGTMGDQIAKSMANGDFSAVLDIINTGLLGGILLLVKNFFNQGLSIDLTHGLGGAIKDTFGQLTGTLKAMQTQIKAKTLLLIAAAVATLTVSIVALSLINSKNLTKALAAITVGFGQLLGAMAILSKIGGKGAFVTLPIMASGLLILAAALVVLSIAMKIMGSMSWNELAKGLVGVAGALVILTQATKGMGKAAPRMITAGLAMIPLAIGLTILATAVKLFATMSWGEMLKGMVGLAASLVIIGTAMRLMPITMPVTAAGLVLVAGAMVILSGALKVMGSMSWIAIAKSMVVLAGALVILAAGLTLMIASLPGAAALVVAAVGITVLSVALKLFGSMSWSEIAKAMVALAASLLILAVGLTAMVAALPGAAALLVASAALAVLVPTLILLGSVSWGTLIKGLVGLAAIFVVLGLAGLVLAPIIPAILGLSAAVLLLGAGLALAGAGMLMFSIAFTTFAATSAAGAAVLTAMLKGLVDMIPHAMTKFAEGIGAFVATLAKKAPHMINALAKILSSMLDAIIKVTPKIGKAFTVLIDTGLNVLIKSTPKMISTGMFMLLSFLRGIEKNIYRIVTVASDIVVKFLKALGDNSGKMIDAGIKMIIKFINGLADGIDKNAAAMRKAGRRLAFSIIDGMTGGLLSGAGRVLSAAKDVASNAFHGAMNFLKAKSPSKLFMDVGRYVDEGFAIGMEKHTGKVTSSASGVAKAVLTTVKDSMANISNAVESNMDYSPTIRPVLDLSEIQKGSGKIGSLLDKPTIDVSGNYSSASRIAGDQRRLRTDSLAETMAKEPSSVGTTISYVQNNNSPKSLSEIEIYRQTKSQLAMAKEDLGI